MTDDKREPGAPGPISGGHDERVRAAFDDLHAALGDRATPEARESVEKLREAALGRDAVRVRGHLEEVKERHGWLYEELIRHPAVVELINELALMGL
jgi:hypothetical protein